MPGILGGVGVARQTAVRRAIRILTDGTQGWWYDPSDMSTLFQDTAGTTPVTAVEQPVGLMLDKSKGLVLGAELVTNGDGSSATGWSGVNGGTPSAAGGNLVLTATAGASYPYIQQVIPVTAGKTYQVTVTGTTGTSGNAPGVNFLDGFTPSINAAITSGVTTRYVLTATGSSATIKLIAAAASATAGTTLFDNISVRELPGNHATQATSTSRPILRNRYNLLTKTEQFDDGVWVKTRSTVSANKLIEDTSASTSHYIGQSTTTVVGTTYKVEVKLKAAERTWALVQLVGSTNVLYVYVNLSTGALGTVAGPGSSVAVTADANGWYKVSANFPADSATTSLRIYTATGDNTAGYTGNGTSGIYVWGADLRPLADASLPYQRVNTATDYDSDTSKFPLYLDADGSDDGMATAAFAAGSDKLTVFAAVHKRSDAALGAVYEFSASTSANNGTFSIFVPNTIPNGVSFRSKGTSLSEPYVTAPAAPSTFVATGSADISIDSALLRVNGVQVASSAADQGTGTYGTYPLYLFRRGGTSLPFNGRFYGGAGKFRTLSAYEIATVEQYLRMKSRAY